MKRKKKFACWMMVVVMVLGDVPVLQMKAKAETIQSPTTQNILVEEVIEKKRPHLCVSPSIEVELSDDSFSCGALVEEESYDGVITYTSSNPKVATVSSDGYVKTKKCGETTITVTAPATDRYSKAVEKIIITVKKTSTDSLLNSEIKSTKSLIKTYSKKPFKLKVKTVGDGKLSFKSSNKKVATVSSSGKVSMKGYGETTIYVSLSKTKQYQGASAKINLTVNPAKAKIRSIKFDGTHYVVSWTPDKRATCFVVGVSKTKKYHKNHDPGREYFDGTRQKIKPSYLRGYKYCCIFAVKKINGKKYYGEQSEAKRIPGRF